MASSLLLYPPSNLILSSISNAQRDRRQLNSNLPLSQRSSAQRDAQLRLMCSWTSKASDLLHLGPSSNTSFCIRPHVNIREGTELVTEEYASNLGDKDGVVIVDHGSRRQESNLMLDRFVSMFKDRTGHQIVEPAHMELAEPSIRVAFTSCVQQGAKRIIVSPFFLFPGRHWHQDIPSLVAEAAREHAGVTYIITAPLGLHELLVDVMNDRIKQCVGHVAGEAEECNVCAGTGKCRLYGP